MQTCRYARDVPPSSPSTQDLLLALPLLSTVPLSIPTLEILASPFPSTALQPMPLETVQAALLTITLTKLAAAPSNNAPIVSTFHPTIACLSTPTVTPTILTSGTASPASTTTSSPSTAHVHPHSTIKSPPTDVSPGSIGLETPVITLTRNATYSISTLASAFPASIQLNCWTNQTASATAGRKSVPIDTIWILSQELACRSAPIATPMTPSMGDASLVPTDLPSSVEDAWC